MWKILEHRSIDKTCKKLPLQVVKKYELWKDIVFRHGPAKLKEFPGFKDELLTGKRKGQKASMNIRSFVMNKRSSKDFISAKKHAILTTGEVIKLLRELKGWTQQDLAKKSSISSTNISMLENDRIEIGKKRVKQLATAFKVHPAIIMFPEFEAEAIAQVA